MSKENKEWSIDATEVTKSIQNGDFILTVKTKKVAGKKVSVRIDADFTPSSPRVKKKEEFPFTVVYTGSYEKYAEYAYDTPELCSVRFNKELITMEESSAFTELLYSEIESED